MTIVDLYPYLIIIGFSILSATAWLLYQSRKQASLTQELTRLNEKLDYDLPDFLRKCWPLLKKSGFIGLGWNLDWFGTEMTGTNGKRKDRVIERHFEVQDISLSIRLYLPQSSWEQRYFSSALAENFFLLVRMNTWIKLGTVQGAFDQTAKMTVFLQHDVKNMVQLIGLTADQLENPVIGQEQKLLQNLREVVPAVRDRAQHMLDALISQPLVEKDSYHQLEDILKQTSNIYKLSVSIEGQATVNIQQDVLQSIIDNVLGNFSRLSRKKDQQTPKLVIQLVKDDDFVIVTIEDLNGTPCLWPERLFEPFWSEHGSGRGIGLYQARQQANAIGGSLKAEAEADKPLKFLLSLPVVV